MKRILFVVATLCFLSMMGCHGNDSNAVAAATKDTSYSIIGKVTGQDSGMVYILHEKTGTIDSARLDHGYFKFSGKADTPEYCRLSLSLTERSVGFFLENGKTSMLIKKESLSTAQIEGTKSQNEFSYFENSFTKSVNERMSALNSYYKKAHDMKDKKALDSLDKVYNVLDAEYKALIAEFVQSHPASMVSAHKIYSNFNYNPRIGQLDSLYNMLDPAIRSSYLGNRIAFILTKEKFTAVGKTAPEFSSTDINGKRVSLSSTRGKYTLLDFWASWCVPCRHENPNIVKAYRTFHDRGFDVFGVSLDDDKVKWMEAIKKDGLNWQQVSDLKGWKAEVVSLYGIQGIPMNYLLDKNGMIVAKDLWGGDLDKKLQELFH